MASINFLLTQEGLDSRVLRDGWAPLEAIVRTINVFIYATKCGSISPSTYTAPT